MGGLVSCIRLVWLPGLGFGFMVGFLVSWFADCATWFSLCGLCGLTVVLGLGFLRVVDWCGCLPCCGFRLGWVFGGGLLVGGDLVVGGVFWDFLGGFLLWVCVV